MTIKRARSLVILPSIAVLGLAACGGSPTAASSSTSTTSTSTSTSTLPAPGPGTIDACIADSAWKSTSVTGTATLAGGVTVALTGGMNETLVILPHGTFTDDLRAVTPISGTGSDGSAYVVAVTGKLTGHVVTDAGSMTSTYDDVTQATTTISKDGTVTQTAAASTPTTTSTYTCVKGVSLTMVSTGGMTTNWVVLT